MQCTSSRSDHLDNNYKEFTWLKDEILRQICTHCAKAGLEIEPSDMITQIDSLKFLDLAMKNPVGWNWKAYAENQMIQALPHECKGYLLAEVTLHYLGDKSKILNRILTDKPRIFTMLDMLGTECYDNYKCRIKSFPLLMEMFYEEYFPNTFFTKVGSMVDSSQKKKEIGKYLKVHELFLAHWGVYRALIRLCTNPPVYSELTIKMVTTVLRSEFSRKYVFEFVPDEISLEVLLCHAKENKFDFWGMYQGKGGMGDQLNPVVNCMKSKTKNSFAKILLKYGFRYSAQQAVYKEQVAQIISFRNLNNSIYARSFETICGKREGMNFRRKMLILNTFATFADLDRTGNIADNISTLVYVSRTIPEPYVTPKEMFDEMRVMLKTSFTDTLQRICEEYEKARIYDREQYTVSEPRRLVHLCRCKIRDSLAENMKLPEGIKQLDLPEYIKGYLELKN